MTKRANGVVAIHRYGMEDERARVLLGFRILETVCVDATGSALRDHVGTVTRKSRNRKNQ